MHEVLKSMSKLSIFRGSKVLVTGHTGFKGSWMSLWLNQLGAEVHGISIDLASEPSHFTVPTLHLGSTTIRSIFVMPNH